MNGYGPNYVDPADRIATFDQDGTTWVEHPFYPQGMFAIDRVYELASQHPAWAEKDPFKAALAGGREAMAKLTARDWNELIGVTHAGMTTEQFPVVVRQWLATAKHPRFKRPYTDLVYQPMLEVMGCLRANGFKTFIVTGGGQEFVRAYAQSVYNIPPEQVVGSSILTKFALSGRQTGADPRAEDVFHRRPRRQSGRNQPVHRQTTVRGLRQLRRRPRDAGMDGRRRWR